MTIKCFSVYSLTISAQCFRTVSLAAGYCLDDLLGTDLYIILVDVSGKSRCGETQAKENDIAFYANRISFL